MALSLWYIFDFASNMGTRTLKNGGVYFSKCNPSLLSTTTDSC